MEELHDRGLIERRSRRDQAAIVDPSSWNRSHDRWMVSVENRKHDQCPIMADRGAIVAKIMAILKQKSWQNRGSFKVNPEATTPPSETAPMTPPIRSHDRINWPQSSGQISL